MRARLSSLAASASDGRLPRWPTDGGVPVGHLSTSLEHLTPGFPPVSEQREEMHLHPNFILAAPETGLFLGISHLGVVVRYFL